MKALVDTAAAATESYDLPARPDDLLARRHSVVGDVVIADPAIPAGDPASGRLTPAQGAGLRALREILFSLDRHRVFGGMRQVWDQTTGDALWVCSRHYPIHDPGLPELPAPTA